MRRAAFAAEGAGCRPVGQPAARTRDRHRRLAGLAVVADELPAIGGAGRWRPPVTSYLALPATRQLNLLRSGIWCATSLDPRYADRPAAGAYHHDGERHRREWTSGGLRAGRENADGSVVPGSIPERSHLDLGGSRERMAGSYPDGRVKVGALDNVIAADLLFGLGKRPVRDQQLALTFTHDLGIADRAERSAVQPDPALGHLFHPRLDGNHHRRVVVRRHLSGLIDPEDQHVLHWSFRWLAPARSLPGGTARNF